MEDNSLLLAMASVIIFGSGAQWLAWRMRLPSILLLLACGFLAGPGLHLVDPEKMLGESLFPFVSLSVAIILFEGSLSLYFSELKQIGRTLLGLLTIGVLVTWGLGTLGARLFLGMDWLPATLLGSILTVTGPTVIGPILRQIRPIGKVGPIARWEGIVIDPIGAVLAVLVFEAYLSLSHPDEAHLGPFGSLVATAFYGTTVGVFFALVLIFFLKRHWIPDHLESLVTLLFVVCAFTGSNIMQHESGLVAVTIMGIIVANSNVQLKQIIEFKESLSLLLISGLFILLAARVEMESFQQLGWGGPLFVLFMILFVRPLAVMLSTIKSPLNWKERVFLAWLAPRGIVAAAVASIFALQLGELGAGLVPATFSIIVGTVVIYGLTAFPLARWLGLATSDPQGVLIVGANTFAQALGHAIQQAGFPVLLVDTNPWNLSQARMQGLRTARKNILIEDVEDEMDLGGIGRLIALTSNDEVNSLAGVAFAELFGKANVFQVTPWQKTEKRKDHVRHLRTRYLFSEDLNYQKLQSRLNDGETIKVTKLSKEFNEVAFREYYGKDAVIMMVVSSGKLNIIDAENEVELKPGQTVIAMVPQAANSELEKVSTEPT